MISSSLFGVSGIFSTLFHSKILDTIYPENWTVKKTNFAFDLMIDRKEFRPITANSKNKK